MTYNEAAMTARMVAAEELHHRIRAALALHQDDGLGRCTTCLTYTSPMPQPKPWPCATARALGVSVPDDAGEPRG